MKTQRLLLVLSFIILNTIQLFATDHIEYRNGSVGTNSIAYFNSKLKTIDSPPVTPAVSISASNTNICPGTSVTFTASPTNGGTPTYQWKINGSNVGTNSSTYSNNTFANGDIVTCEMTTSLVDVTATTATSNALTITVNTIVSASVSITSTSTNICSGTSVTFTPNPTNGGTAPTYHWYQNGSLIAINNGTYTTTTLANGNPVMCNMVSSAACPNSSSVASNSIITTVTPTVTPSVFLSLNPSTTTVCQGANVVFTANPTNAGTTPTYQWYLNGSPTGTNSATYSNNALISGNSVYCELTSSNTCVTSATAASSIYTYTVTQPVTPSVSILASATSICGGTTVTFTATPANGGTPTYQWFVNGSLIGGTTATLNVSSLANGDVVTCVMTSSLACVTATTATSNAVTMSVTPSAAASVSITGTNAICAGTSVTFTAAPTNGGSAPVYQWLVNGSPVGTNSPTYTTSTLANGNSVRCYMISNATCPNPTTVYSNVINMTVTATATPSVFVSRNPSSANVCEGANVVFTASPSNGGSTPTYQWYLNGSPVGTNSATYSNNSLVTGNTVNCVLTSNASCLYTTTANSNIATMSVTPPVTPAVSITASNASICAGSNVTFTATPTNGGTPTYQWYINGSLVGSTATYSTSTLVDNDIVTCIMTSSLTCVTAAAATSNEVTMSVTSTSPASVSITSTGTTICAGSAVTFTATPTNGGPTPTYQWQVNGSNVGSNSDTYTSSTLANGNTVRCRMTSSSTCPNPTLATSNILTMTVTGTVMPSVSVSRSPSSTTICEGTNVVFTANPVNGGTTPVYQWYLNGSPVGTNSATYSNNTLATGNTVSCMMTSNASCLSSTTASSSVATYTVTSPVTPSVSISASSTNVCAGTSVTFTATPTNGGSPNYQWYVNGLLVTSGTPTYSSSTLVNSDVVTCVMTSSLTCATATTATSNAVTMSVTSTTPASVSITSTNTTICAGSAVTFTATPTNGGPTPTYQWQVNGSNVGTNSATYTTSTLADGNTVRCRMTSSSTCPNPTLATSNIITMTVTATVAPSVSVSRSPSSTTICDGTNVVFTANPGNGGTTPAYQWYLNGLPVGTNSATYSNNTLATGNTVSCVMTSNASCLSSTTASSSVATYTVTSPVTPAVSITASNTNICAGSNVTFTATPTNGGSPNYQWYVNGSLVTSGTPTYSSSTLVDSDIVTCVMTTSLTCVTTTTATSNAVTMSVTSTTPASVSITGTSTTICAGSPVTFTAVPTNGGTTPNYQWQVNGSNVGANSPTYTTSTLANGNNVRCLLTSGSTCPNPVTSTSNTITMTVTANVTPSVSINPNTGTTACVGANVIFTASSSNGGVTPAYQWYLNGSPVGTNSNTYSNSSLVTGNTVNCVLTSSLTCVTSQTANSSVVVMTVNSSLTPTVSITATNTTVCPSTNVQFTATPTNGGTPTYQWQKNGVNVGANSATYTTSGFANGDVMTCIMTSSLTCVTATTATSNAVTMTVTPTTPVSVSIISSSGSTICAGTSVTFTATPTNGGATPNYQWYQNGSAVGANSPTYTTSTLANGQNVYCNMTSSIACPSSSTVSSNPISMTVTSTVTPSVFVSRSPSSSTICEGTNVIFTANPTNGGTTPVYQWYLNGSPVGTNSPYYSNNTLASGNTVNCVMTSNAACISNAIAPSSIITYTVTQPVTPAVAITASATTICTGNNVTFTATPTNGGTPIYQWQRNGANIGTNSATFSSGTLTNGDIITCIMTSSVACVTSPTATSNGITITVSPTLPSSVSIATASTSICAGTPTTFTATPTNGGPAPIYQWYQNGSSVGTNSPTYTSTTLANGHTVVCYMTSSAACPSPTQTPSNTITMAVTAVTTPFVSVSTNPGSSICEGTNVIFSAGSLNGGSTPIYQWYLNGSPVGTNSSIYSNNSLVNGNTVSCTLTSNQACVTTPTANSSNVTMVVNTPVTPAVSITASATTVCSGAYVSYTATPTNGGTPTYQWFRDGLLVGTGVSYGMTALNDGEVVTCVMTSSLSCVTSTTAASNAITMTVNPNLIPSVVISANPGNTICAGTSVTFTATPTNGGSTPVYQWYVNGSSVGTNSPTYTSTTLANGSNIVCYMTSNAACPNPTQATSNTIAMAVTSNVTPFVNISTNPGSTICAGTNVIFTANPGNAGTPAYQWYLNGSPVGTNSSTYSNSSLANGNTVSCILTSNLACVTSTTANSGNYIMTVNPVVTPAVSISASATTVCAGTNVTYTATPTNGGTPTYQWFRNGLLVGTGSSFNTSTLTNSDVITCVMTSSLTCVTATTATSNAITMMVNPNVTPSVNISASSTTICAGSSVTFTATPTNGGTTPTYQWYVNGSSAGTNSPTFTSTTLPNGSSIVCYMTSNAACPNPTQATSNTITMTVTSNVTPFVNISINPGNIICAGTNVIFTANPGNGGTPAYQWYLNGSPVGTNSSTYSNSSLANGNTVSCILTSNLACVTSTTANSGNYIMTVNPLVTPAVSISASATTICTGSNATFTATPTNGGTPTYQWFRNGLLVGTNSATYSSTGLTNSDVITCVMTSSLSCVTATSVTSNAITMTVNPNTTPYVNISANPGSTICAGTSVTFTATPTNGGSTPSYQWYVNGSSVGTNSPTYTSATLANGNNIVCYMTSNAACPSPTTATSNTITMAVTTNVTPFVNISTNPGNTICAGTNVIFTANPGNGGTPAYQWYLNGSPVGTNSNVYSNSSLANGNTVNCILTSSLACVTSTTANSSNITMSVGTPVTPAVSISASATTICTGTNVTFTATPVNGGTPVYQWYRNGLPVGTNSVTYSSAGLTNSDVITCVMTSSLSCVTATSVTSNAITMNVNPNAIPSVNISANPGNSICAGTSVTFTATPTNGGATPSYQWYVNGSSVGTNSPTYTTTTLANGNNVICYMTGSAACSNPTTAASNTITMVVTTNVTPAASISLNPGTSICAGTNVIFTANHSNAGTPTYQWYVNGSPVGTNNYIYSNSSLANGNTVNCVVTSSLTCVTTPTVTSNTVTMAVGTPVTPAVSISSTATTICTGTNVTFTATPTNGGTPTYQWFRNGLLVGTNSATYNPSGLINGDVITCTMTSSLSCATATNVTSNAITMTVNLNATPSVNIVSNAASTICAGTSVTFTATPTNGGVTPTYQWQVNGSNVGTNSPTYTSTTLANNNNVTCNMISTAACPSPATATSNTITMAVTTNVTPSISVSTSTGTTICSGTNVVFTASTSNAGTPTYQWYLNGSPVGNNSYTYSNGSLVSGNTVNCVLTSSLTCVTSPTATSTTATMTVNTPVTPAVTISASATTICAGTNVTFTATPTNGGSPAYHWYKNGISTGVTSATYNSSSLTSGDVITCFMTSSLSCVTSSTAASNAITMTVNPTIPSSVSISSTATTICAGSSVTFTATPTNGGTPSYQWKLNGSNVGTNSSTYTSVSLANGNTITCQMVSSLGCATPATATSNTITMVVTTNVTPTASVTASTGSTACAGANVTFTATGTNLGTPTYQWYLNGSPVGTNSNTYSNNSLVTGNTVNCVITSSLTCVTSSTATSNTVTMTVNTPVTPAVSISASATTICAGTNVTFTATPTNGGTPTYQWYRNGSPVGTNSATYSSTALTNGDIITCTLTSSLSCVTSSTATSNAITLTVNPTTPISVSIASTSTSICAGSSVTFTATPTNGGTPSYQWQVNGSNVGTNSDTYTSSTLANGNTVRCIMTSTLSCPSPATATSNVITMTVTAYATPSVSISKSPSGTICGGTNVTFTASPVNGGTAPSYQWYLNGSPVGTNSATYSNAALANGNTVYCVMTSNFTCLATPTATSNTLTMAVTTPLTPSVSISASPGSTICAGGTNVTFTATPTNGGIPTYQWFRNGSLVGTNSATYSSTTFANGDVMTCVMYSSIGCVTSGTGTSNAVTMTVNPTTPISVSIAGTSSSICAGTPVTFTATPTNGGTPSYQWQVNGSNVGTNSDTYTSSTLANGNTVRCIMTSSLTCPSPATATSNVITMTVTSNVTPTASITASTGSTTCAGTNVTFTATGTNLGTPTYQWYLNGSPVGTNSNTYSNNSLATGNTVNCVITSSVTCVTTPTATSNTITMTVDTPVTPAVSISASNTTICSGTNVTFTATPTNGGTPTYQWYRNGSPVGTNSATYSSTTFANGDVITCTLTSSLSCVTASTANSNSVTMTVSSSFPASVSIASNPGSTICTGTSVTFTATPTNGGTPSYQWFLNGSPVGTNSTTYTNGTLSNGNVVSCQMTSSLGCASPAVSSNSVTMTVNAIVTPAVTVSPNTGTTACGAATVTFTATPTNGGGSPSYQWYLNGAPVGTNSSTYSNSTLVSGNTVYCVMTSSLMCLTTPSGTSNTVTMTITTPATPDVTISASATTICAGSSVTFTATPTNGGTPSYQWYRNGSPVGTNSSTYTTSAATNGSTIYCVMTSSLGCVTSSTASSNTITMTVNSLVSNSVSISSSTGSTNCTGEVVTFTATPTNGGATPDYIWYVNGTPVWSGSPYVTSSLITGDVVICEMQSSIACPSPSTAISNNITMTTYSSSAPTASITSNSGSNICTGENVTFTATGINIGTSPSYQWYLNGSPVGTNSATYSTSALVDGSTVNCVVTSNAPCVSGQTATTNIITINVLPTVTPAVTISASATTICTGTSVTFTATPTNGGGSPDYQWYRNGSPVGTNSSTYTSTTLTNGMAVTCVLTSSASCVTVSTATSNSITMTVSSSYAASVSISANTGSTICAGNSVTFTATPTNGGTPGYQWKLNGSNVGTNSAVYTNASLTDGDVVTCQMTSSLTCATPATSTSNSITMTVNSTNAPTASITSDQGPGICAGGTVNFSAGGTNIGGSPDYQWFLNGSPVGINSASYSASNPSNGSTVYCVITSNASCVSGQTASSNTISINIVAPVTPVVSISSSATSICDGTSVTFTATPTNGGGSPDYQWYRNGSPVGGNSSSYSSSTLNNGDVVTCMLTSSLSCVTGSTANSNSITITVNPTVLTSVSITNSAGSTVCFGQSITFTATPTNGGTPSYQWYVNGSPVGTNSPTYITSGLTNGSTVSCAMTSSLSCPSPAIANSNVITMTVNTNVTPTVSITANPGSSICGGTNVTFTASATNEGSSPTYQWFLNGSPVGTNSTTYSNSSLVNGNTINCVVTSSTPCVTGPTASSNTITMNVTTPVAPSISITASATTICPGASINFNATVSNGGVSPVYQWKVNGTNVGTNSSTYSSSSLNNGDVVICVLTSSISCVTNASVNSNGITITVNPTTISAVSISSTGSTICSGTSVTFTATPTNGGTPMYQWFVNSSPVGTNSSTYTSSSLNNNDVVSCEMVSSLPCNAPTVATSNVISMTVNSTVAPTVSIVSNQGSTICAGSTITFTATPTNGGGTPSYQWLLNGSPVGTNASVYSNSSLVNGDVVNCILTSSATCPSTTTATSNSVTINVTTPVTPVVSISSSATTICAGTNVTFTATSTNGGGTPTYQWFVNGSPVGTNSATYVTSALNNGEVVTCQLTSSITCVTTASATSNSISMTVNPSVSTSVSISNSTGSTICSGTSVTFTATATNGGTPTYQWFVNGSPVGTNSATYVTSTLNNGEVVTCQMTSSLTCAAPAIANSNAITMTVNSTTAPTISITSNEGSSICAGTSVTFTASATNGGATPVYQWMLNGSPVGTNSSTYSNGLLANGDVVTCVLTSSAICPATTTAASNAITFTVNSIITTSVSIATASTTICSGTSVTFTATPTNGGTPTYQWFVGSTPVGTNSATYTTSALTNGQVVSCQMSSSLVCATPAIAASNTITMTVNSSATPTISITSNPSAASICSGTSVTFTANISNGGSSPVYQWKLNGSNVGTNSSTYSNSTLTTGDAVTCELTSNAPCISTTTVTSNSISKTVTPSVTPTITIVSNPGMPVCDETNITFTATITNGGANPSYQWKKNGLNTGTNTVSHNPFSPADGDIFTCVLTSNATCATSAQVTSNPITIDITTINATVTVNDNTITATQSGATYQWYSCSTQEPIQGATQQSFEVTESGLYFVEITVGSCTDESNCEFVNWSKIDEFTSAGIVLYPNPAKDYFIIDLPENISTDMILYDIAGRKVLEGKLEDNQQIDVHSLATGSYRIVLNDGSRQYVGKVIVNR